MKPTPSNRPRHHFIVKHDLASFHGLPNRIWRTGQRKKPHRFDQIKKGDRWVAFAYTTSDYRERPLSLVTGFYECTEEAWYGSIPAEARTGPGNCTKAWFIEGKRLGEKLADDVGVPPIDELVGESTYKNQAIIPITVEGFERARDYVYSHQLNPRSIPLLGREPHNEQELLAAVVYGHKELGIKEIIRVRKAFPDLMVRVGGRKEPVHLELEVYSSGFTSHGHIDQVRNRCFMKDGTPVAVLCWINDDKALKTEVHRVYELQEMLLRGQRIRW